MSAKITARWLSGAGGVAGAGTGRVEPQERRPRVGAEDVLGARVPTSPVALSMAPRYDDQRVYGQLGRNRSKPYTGQRMTSSPWTSQEQKRLRHLRLDPLRTSRERLTALVRHFMKGNGIWTVSEGPKGALQVSRG